MYPLTHRCCHTILRQNVRSPLITLCSRFWIERARSRKILIDGHTLTAVICCSRVEKKIRKTIDCKQPHPCRSIKSVNKSAYLLCSPVRTHTHTHAQTGPRIRSNGEPIQEVWRYIRTLRHRSRHQRWPASWHHADGCIGNEWPETDLVELDE